MRTSPPPTNDSQDTLYLELVEVLNYHSAEQGSDTPDLILAEYLLACLQAFDEATRQRDHWWRHPAKWMPPSLPAAGEDKP